MTTTTHRSRRRILLLFGVLFCAGILVYCGSSGWSRSHVSGRSSAEEIARVSMVERQIKGRGVEDPRVLAAFDAVPRHLFVPEAHRAEAYEDRPLPIGFDQTISQPYVVAAMTELLKLDAVESPKILEVWTGSGYQAAILAHLGASVFTIEIIEPLAERAAAALREAGFDTVRVRVGDGFEGWPEAEPFDGIIVTAAPPEVPAPLLDQLKVGGRLVIPVGRDQQMLKVIERTQTGTVSRDEFAVRFVPMTGRAQDPPPAQ